MIVDSKKQSEPSITTRRTPAVQGAAAFSKGIAVLQLISEYREPPTINQLMNAIDLTRPTLYRLLKALESEGLVECTNKKTYKLGARLIQFASRAFEQNDVARFAEPEMQLLHNMTKETCHLAIRCGQEMIYLCRKDGPQSITLQTSVGNRVPLHASAIGKCVMAYLPLEEQEVLIDSLELTAITPYTITNQSELVQQLADISETGYATAHQETDLDIHCFAAAIFDRSGNPVGGISVSIPLYRLTADRNRYVQPLMAACQRVTDSLCC